MSLIIVIFTLVFKKMYYRMEIKSSEDASSPLWKKIIDLNLDYYGSRQHVWKTLMQFSWRGKNNSLFTQ